jgi:hypothetical protein
MSNRPVDIVLAALKALGGIGQIHEIAAQCDVLGHPQPEPSVRRLLQEFSSDAVWAKAQKPRSAVDLFYSLEGVEKRTGYWGLRGFTIQAPDEYPIPGLRRAHAKLLDRAETPLGKNRPRGIAYTKDGTVHAVQVGFAPDAPYPDRLLADGRIEHVGEGRERVQSDTAGNHGMLEALENGSEIPVFQAIGRKGEKRYADLGWYRVIGSERRQMHFHGEDHDTDAFVFTLMPAEVVRTEPAAVEVEFPPAARLSVEAVPVENRRTERTRVSARAEIEAIRRESALVESFTACATAKGLTVKRWKIIPEGAIAPLLTDPCIMQSQLLIEAKGNLDRNAFRLAIGQLADYRRFLKEHTCAILVPSKPSHDLLDLARIERIAVIWPSATDFEGTIQPW